MAAYTGTVPIKPKGGELGALQYAQGKFTVTVALADEDTITIADVLPQQGAEVVDIALTAAELDTDGSPTMTFTVGDGTDADGYFTSTSGGAAISNVKGRGALVGTKVTSRDIVLTVTAAVATGATSGDIYFDVFYRNI